MEVSLRGKAFAKSGESVKQCVEDTKKKRRDNIYLHAADEKRLRKRNRNLRNFVHDKRM